MKQDLVLHFRHLKWMNTSLKTWYQLLFTQKQIKSQLEKTKPELLQNILSATGCEWNFLLHVPTFTYCSTAQLITLIYLPYNVFTKCDTKSGPDEGIRTKSYFDASTAFSQQKILTL